MSLPNLAAKCCLCCHDGDGDVQVVTHFAGVKLEAPTSLCKDSLDCARHQVEARLSGGDEEAMTPYTPDLAHIRSQKPDRTDRGAFMVWALRYAEDVLDYAERLTSSGPSDPWRSRLTRTCHKTPHPAKGMEF